MGLLSGDGERVACNLPRLVRQSLPTLTDSQQFGGGPHLEPVEQMPQDG